MSSVQQVVNAHTLCAFDRPNSACVHLKDVQPVQYICGAQKDGRGGGAAHKDCALDVERMCTSHAVGQHACWGP